MSRRVILLLVGTSMLSGTAGCTSRDRGRAPWHDDSPPEFSVSLPQSVATRIGLDSVRLVPASPIGFAATIEPDRGHARPVLVPIAGESKTLEVRRATHVRRGDTVLSLRRVGDQSAAWVAMAPSDGLWRPMRYSGESVWPGDTLGTVQSESWYRAIGRVDDVGRSPARTGDSAAIELPAPSGKWVSGRVAEVSMRAYGGTDVIVHFQATDGIPPSASSVQVTVVPRESLLVAPRGALVTLSYGPAVFMPQHDGVFAVRFLIVDQHAGLGAVVHGGLERTTEVAAGDLGFLQAAAEDSLSSIRRRSR